MRYYYTDPLAAAWMAKHFGMRFVHGKQCVIGWKNFEWQAPKVWDQPFHIHPDSVAILNPKEYDEGVDAYGAQCWFSEELGWILPDGYDVTDPVTIDKRGGKAFFWPESEAD